MSDGNNGAWKPAAIPPWDGKTELSVICPFVNEGQNVCFTTQALIGELTGFCKFEIILIDNQSDWYIDCSIRNERLSLHRGREQRYRIRSRAYFEAPPESHKAGSRVNTWFFRKGIVRYFQYDDKQSHWCAKNHGVAHSRGKYLFFVDAHCLMEPGSLRRMVEFLRHPPEEKIGGVHALICYMLDSHPLEYLPQKNKFFGYKFISAQTEAYAENGKRRIRQRQEPYKVCIMSTCGMMSPRRVFEELGGWHPEFGSYCGGEGYINLKHSTCGWHHWIHPQALCWHWAEKRGYSWRHDDYVRNEQIAAYVNGGDPALQFCIDGRGGSAALRGIADDVRAKCEPERAFVAARQVETLENYFERWVKNPGTWAK